MLNDNHVDNNLKEILVYVYYGSFVNNRPKYGAVNSLKHFSISKTMHSYTIARYQSGYHLREDQNVLAKKQVLA